MYMSMYMYIRQVSVDELGQEAKRLAAVMKDKQAELQSLMQQVSGQVASWQVVHVCHVHTCIYTHRLHTLLSIEGT